MSTPVLAADPPVEVVLPAAVPVAFELAPVLVVLLLLPPLLLLLPLDASEVTLDAAVVAVAVASAADPVIAPGPWLPLNLTAVLPGAWSLLTVPPVVGCVMVASTALKMAAKSVVGVAAPASLEVKKSHRLWLAALTTDS
ncbi:hypothetical protein VP1G_11288 [Cytospora mali]|uniref:Uncharacterized protein n=1 Tax=Cytospora mali TaxID=578113 RepID=A0A194VDA2_CYTMA|nr:hypothetical protein VP1G_11288 [Valsa mali var. pyri (nom. inval.)]